MRGASIVIMINMIVTTSITYNSRYTLSPASEALAGPPPRPVVLRRTVLVRRNIGLGDAFLSCSRRERFHQNWLPVTGQNVFHDDRSRLDLNHPVAAVDN